MVSNSEVVRNYFEASDREHYNRGSNLFFRGNTLYSYGTHFILAEKIKNGYLINGDIYSVTTSRHQSITRRFMPSNNVIIPFSALYRAIPFSEPKKMEILDRLEDTYETVTYTDPKTNELKERQIHHLGASLIKYKNKYLLSGLDPSSKNFGAYYIILLKKPAQTVKEAFRQLAGNLTDKEYNDYLEGIIKRQGEFFLIPTDYTTRQIRTIGVITPRKIKHDFDLSKGIGNAHIAKDAVKLPDGLYIKRSLRHPEHRMQSLKNVWHRVVKNIQKNSWTASGNVD